jgi:hypothetical protein
MDRHRQQNKNSRQEDGERADYLLCKAHAQSYINPLSIFEFIWTVQKAGHQIVPLLSSLRFQRPSTGLQLSSRQRTSPSTCVASSAVPATIHQSFSGDLPCLAPGVRPSYHQHASLSRGSSPKHTPPSSKVFGRAPPRPGYLLSFNLVSSQTTIYPSTQGLCASTC